MGGALGQTYHVNGNTYHDLNKGAGNVLHQMLASGNYKDFQTLSSSLAHGSLKHTMDGMGGSHFWANGCGRPHHPGGFGHHHGFGHHPHHGFGHHHHGFGPQPRPY